MLVLTHMSCPYILLDTFTFTVSLQCCQRSGKSKLRGKDLMGVVALLPSSPSYYQLVQLIFHAMMQPWLCGCILILSPACSGQAPALPQQTCSF